MYLSMGWMLAGFMVVIVAANAAPMVRPLKRMLPIAAVYSVMMSAVLWLIAGPITGSIEGHFDRRALRRAVGAAIAILCVSVFAMFLERLLGMLAVIPAIGTLMFLGVPSSNGALSMYLTPVGFRTLHDFLPMPAAVETIRSILYFGGDVTTEHLQVLGLWGLVSLALVFVVDSVKTVRTEHDFGDLVQPGGATEQGAITGGRTAADDQPRPRTIGDGSSRDLEPVGA